MMNTVQWDELVIRALEEDQVLHDITTFTFVKESLTGLATIIARAEGVLCGVPAVEKAFELTGNQVQLEWLYQEGEIFPKDSKILQIKGNIRNILLGERVALNFLSLLSGIATLTNQFVEKVKPYGCKIRDTRKTHPGLRDAEKYAVRVGGGENHRLNLSTFGLIKENHILASGGYDKLLLQLKELNTKNIVEFELEVENLEQFQLALNVGIKEILLDNFTPQMVQQAVAMNVSNAILEASGGIRLDNVEDYARTGVHRISVGAITHSALPIDFSLRIQQVNLC
ncbi:MAG: carboxylating nicotinate-nucleotide diphosphorylase [bacterium]|nr:carboxylating nicotinate-nucleotide diphosphorylase [bacterium]